MDSFVSVISFTYRTKEQNNFPNFKGRVNHTKAKAILFKLILLLLAVRYTTVKKERLRKTSRD